MSKHCCEKWNQESSNLFNYFSVVIVSILYIVQVSEWFATFKELFLLDAIDQEMKVHECLFS